MQSLLDQFQGLESLMVLILGLVADYEPVQWSPQKVDL
jgi:hypothetical protein